VAGRTGSLTPSPAAADLDGDRRPEIVISRRFKLLSASGNLVSINGHPLLVLGHVVWSSSSR
jgi:hypothetical protein